jgi:transcriptional regulator with XRE-family HTH domain
MQKEKDSKWLERLREELKIYMIKHEKSQEEVGEMLGVTRTSVNRLLNGQTAPDIHKLDIYVDKFDIDMNYVFSGNRKMNDSKIDKMYFMIEKIYKKEFLMHPSIAAESDEIYKKADVAKVNKKVNKDNDLS